MLDQATAELVVKAVNNGDGIYSGIIISVEEAKLMKEIETDDGVINKTYALQKGEVTILVKLYATISGDRIPDVRLVCW